MIFGQKFLDEPKTMGECWTIFKMFGFVRPNLPLDDSLFPNARKLVELNNEVYHELKRVRG